MNTYFANSRELRQLTHKARQLAQLQHLYQQIAPPTLARASHVIELERNTLILGADNSAIAAKLRQLGPQLVKFLNGRGAEVTGIQVRVQVAITPASHVRVRPELSAIGHQHLSNLAGALPHSPLKSALRRLTKLR